MYIADIRSACAVMLTCVEDKYNTLIAAEEEHPNTATGIIYICYTYYTIYNILYVKYMPMSPNKPTNLTQNNKHTLMYIYTISN